MQLSYVKEKDTLLRFEDSSYLLRIFITIFPGLVVAGFLTWFMYVLIQFSGNKLDESARVYILDFVRLDRQESSDRKERKLERPKTEQAPPMPATPENSEAESDFDAIGISDIPAGDMEVDIGGLGISAGEGEFLPIVKVAPVYPLSAATRGLEGECTVEYTVTTTGATRDIHVLDSRCTDSVFRRPSINAAKRFKYKPRIINGEAVEVLNVHNVFIYTLEDSEQSGQN